MEMQGREHIMSHFKRNLINIYSKHFRIQHKRRNGSEGNIEFTSGVKPYIGKGKKGQLMVVSLQD